MKVQKYLKIDASTRELHQKAGVNTDQFREYLEVYLLGRRPLTHKYLLEEFNERYADIYAAQECNANQPIAKDCQHARHA